MKLLSNVCKFLMVMAIPVMCGIEYRDLTPGRDTDLQFALALVAGMATAAMVRILFFEEER